MENRYTELIRVRFTPEQMQILKRQAILENLTLAELVRTYTLKRLKESGR